MLRALIAAPIMGVIGPTLAVALLGAAGVLVGSYTQYVLALAIVNCIVGAALVMIVGYTRVIMLAAGAMMAIGAYASTILIIRTGLPYLATLPLAAILGACGGIILAVPATRFRGHHLAMATMVFQFLVVIGIREWADVTGGALGLRVPAVQIGGITITSDIGNLALITSTGMVAIFVLSVLLSGSFGKTLRAASASELACDAFGVDVVRLRIAAFAFSSGVVAYAGALLAPRVRILDPVSFDITQSVLMLGYPIVGGMASIWGGLLGGAIFQLLPEVLRSVGRYQEILMALLVILVMVVLPSGLIGLFRSFVPDLRRGAKPTIQRFTELTASASIIHHSASPLVLSVRNARKSYGALVAVDSVDLELEAGVIHGLIGPNGAGKTTLFNAVSGFVPLDEGSIHLFGRRADTESSRTRITRGVTRTFQHVAVFGDLSCLDNVIVGLGRNTVWQTVQSSFEEVFDLSRYRHRTDAAYAALAAVGLEKFASEPANSLSLGNQRRLEIARAIVSRPRLILFDEPVSGVSREEEMQIADLLRSLNRTRGITMLIIEHNIGFVRALCSTMSVMASGQIIAHGKPDAIIDLAVVRHHYFGDGRAVVT